MIAENKRWKPIRIAGWGQAHHADVLATRPDSSTDVLEALADCGDDSIIVHAGGRSYADTALNAGGRVILTERLNRIVSFDPVSLDIVCEPGVTFHDLLEVLAPRGYLVPVSPGTGYVTIGGAVGSDVHGKNHEHAGSFGQHVRWIDLALASGEVRRISPVDDPELFAATVGGLGLTGVMLRVCFRMSQVPSTDVILHERRLPDLEAFIGALEECRKSSTFSVGWIDGLARGKALGRGILGTAEIADPPTRAPRKKLALTIPFDLPSPILNRVSVGAFNAVYYRRAASAGRVRRIPISRYFYPLDQIRNWNRVYGHRGFDQFQCVIPDADAKQALFDVMTTIAQANAAPFLGVIKTFGGEGIGHLSFPMSGFTLALDFPHTDTTVAVLRRLNEITVEYQGRVYLAKDGELQPKGFRAMYPQHDVFRSVVERVDPEGRFSSDLSRRLEIR